MYTASHWMRHQIHAKQNRMCSGFFSRHGLDRSLLPMVCKVVCARIRYCNAMELFEGVFSSTCAMTHPYFSCCHISSHLFLTQISLNHFNYCINIVSFWRSKHSDRFRLGFENIDDSFDITISFQEPVDCVQ